MAARVLIILAVLAILPARVAHAREQRNGSLGATCVDKEIADRLAVKRRRRGADPRWFVKAQRHELSATGGYFVSDLFSATYIVGGAYTFHMTEDTAVEASFSVTHADAELARAIEDNRAQVVKDVYSRQLFASSLLLFYPAHGKMRIGGSIVHFDVHFDLGVGVVDSSTSRGAAGVGGVGLKFFMGKAWAFRIDARDHVYRQDLLDAKFLVNDVAVTAGLSLFLPLGF